MINSRLANAIFLAFFYLSLILASYIPTYALAQDVRVVNTAKYVGSGRYAWTIFLVAEESVLNAIDYVEYILHPSFPEPVRVSNDRDTNFALSSNGWGEFNVFVKIVFKDRPKMHLEHWLRLEDRIGEEIEMEPKPFPFPEHSEIKVDNSARYLGNRVWEWTVFIETDPETLSQIEHVEYILHPTFPEPVRLVSTRHNNFAFTARGWGIFEIKIRVVFKNRTERYLTHMLKFKKK